MKKLAPIKVIRNHAGRAKMLADKEARVREIRKLKDLMLSVVERLAKLEEAERAA